MIPSFPEFKRIETSDRELIEAYTRPYPPYSDFNFTSMYSWDIHGKMFLSELNGNLVVHFTDYITAEPFYSFLGTKLLDETASTLIQFSEQEGLNPILRLVPSIVAEKLDTKKFNIKEERDQADYVTSVYRLHTYSGTELSAKRRQRSLFLRKNTDSLFRQMDLSDQKTMQDVLALFSVWLTTKNEHLRVEEEHEFNALRRCLDAQFTSLIATGIFIKKSLVAFWILEDLGNGYAISHFEKADLDQYVGISPFLKQKTAEILHKRGLVYVNLEQDLGIPGLRKNKESYYPQHFLKKLTVTLC